MSRRFYLPQSFTAAVLKLTGNEAHHLSRVLRLKPGDEVQLFDGAGRLARARISALGSDEAELEILERLDESQSPRTRVTLATAVPKGERFDWLVEKATELGVDRLVPLLTARSVVNPGETKLERLRRTIVEASKQCGRSRLMELTAPVRWNDLVTREFARESVWVADPSGEAGAGRLSGAGEQILVAVGPEGGFTTEELELATQHGAKLIGLGRHILRIETAALALAVLCGAGVEERG
jgi:16S rRNA (uracil1498-N3)-methyltransferase